MKRIRNICFAVVAVITVLCVAGVMLYNNSNAKQNDENRLIKSVGSAEVINVVPGEEVTLLVVAKNEAQIYVDFGNERYEAKQPAKADGYSAFFVKIKMPPTAEEIASMGKLTAVAVLNGKTEQLQGPEIYVTEIQSTKKDGKNEGSSVYNIDNYNPTYIDTEQEAMPFISEALSKATTNAFTTPFTGNQMAVVTAERADVKPTDADTDYLPCFPAVSMGTTDFVVGESSSFDEDEGKTYYYYNLASGLKVRQDAVVLQNAVSMPENSISVSSVYASDGDITIRLNSTWKVPYFANLENQQYYSAYDEHFNVTGFNATGLTLSFHYTTSAQGNIDCSQSDIIASAGWTLSPETKVATLHLPFRQQGVFYGMSIYYEGNETVITVKGRPKGLAGSVVVLDPGHGYDDCGTTGLGEAVKESDINILVAYHTKAYLEQQGVTVYMTRYGDDDISLEGRKIFARNVKPDLFVSIHSDGSEKNSSIGTSAYYYKPFSVSLATNIYNEMLSLYKNSFYPGRYDLYGEIDRGVRYYPFSVTRLDECPSTLVEIGFLTNDAECYMLTRTESQQLIGQAISRGICTTLTQ